MAALTQTSPSQTPTQKYRDKRRAEGGCLWCPEPAAPGRTLCSTHLEVQRKRAETVREKNKAAGMCIVCGTEPPEPGKTRCHLCNLSQNDANLRHRTKRKAQGICPKCGKHKPAKGHTYCSICLRKNWRNVRRVRANEKRMIVAERCRAEFKALLVRNPDSVIERLAALIKGRDKPTSESAAD